MKYFISAGEASGDLHASQVIKHLLSLDSEARIEYLGGDLMAGFTGTAPTVHYRDMAFMGFIDVIAHLPKVLGNLKIAKKAIERMRPDALVLVDYPGFNLKLAKFAKRRGIKVFYYIAPKLWAWKEYRIKQLRKYVDCIFSILPFEKDWFAERGLKVEYVGNPSVEEVEATLRHLGPREEFLKRHNLDPSRQILALVPGSRVGEIKANLPVMHEAAKRHPDMQVVVACAPSVDKEVYERITDAKLIEASTLEIMGRSRAALVTSGTASLECALAGCPQVVCYRAVGWKWAHDLFVHILKIPYASLPNLIAGKIDRETRRAVNQEARKSGVRGCAVPELLVHNCTSDKIEQELAPLLADSRQRRAQLEAYAEIRKRLDTPRPAAYNVADLIYRKTVKQC